MEYFIKHHIIFTSQERLQSQMKRLAILNLVTINIESKDADNDSLKLCNFSGTDLHMNQEAQLSQVAETNPRAEARTVSLSQFVTEEDISDESEYEEIIADIKKIFLPFGILESIIIRVHSGLDVHSDTAASGDSISGADESEQQCLVFVTFTSSIAAGAAATAINGEYPHNLCYRRSHTPTMHVDLFLDRNFPCYGSAFCRFVCIEFTACAMLYDVLAPTHVMVNSSFSYQDLYLEVHP